MYSMLDALELFNSAPRTRNGLPSTINCVAVPRFWRCGTFVENFDCENVTEASASTIAVSAGILFIAVDHHTKNGIRAERQDFALADIVAAELAHHHPLAIDEFAFLHDAESHGCRPGCVRREPDPEAATAHVEFVRSCCDQNCGGFHGSLPGAAAARLRRGGRCLSLLRLRHRLGGYGHTASSCVAKLQSIVPQSN